MIILPLLKMDELLTVLEAVLRVVENCIPAMKAINLSDRGIAQVMVQEHRLLSKYHVVRIYLVMHAVMPALILCYRAV